MLLYQYAIEVVEDVCDILNIPRPNISFNFEKVKSKEKLEISPTTRAIMVIKEGGESTLYLNKKYFVEDDDKLRDFTIAHELRHYWQYLHDVEKYIHNYKLSKETEPKVDYNNQLAEIDANAFAMLYIKEMYGVVPVFNNKDFEYEKVRVRMAEIEKELDI